MKTITLFLLWAACQLSFAGGDTNIIIATSDWSKPVSTVQGQTLRARMLIGQGWSAGFDGPWPETQFYLELQRVEGADAPMQIYFDPSRQLHCELLDANGKPPPPTPLAGSGAGGATGHWISVSKDSTIRLRANLKGYGTKKR